MSYEDLKSVLVLAALITAGGVFGLRVYRLLWVNMRRGQPSGPFGRWGERLKGLVIFVGGQVRLFRFLWPGTAHFFIFWGFLALSLTILQAILEGLLSFNDPNFVLPILGTFGPLAFLQDVLAVVVIGAVGYGLYLRQIVDPERYKGSHKSQGVMVLLFIFTIMLSLLVINGIRINLGEDPIAGWRPISAAIGTLFAGLNEPAQVAIEESAYWVHLGVVLVFLTELPGGKHFHVVTSLPAVLLRNLEPVGRLPEALELDGEVGVSAVEHFQWRQMLDFYTCTECGRCQDVCPAYNSGLALSPKMLMMGLRDNLMARGEVLASQGPNGNGSALLDQALVGEVITDDVLWACTTCYACDQECPLFIEHVTPIVDMRRHLVIEGRVEAELQDALANLGRYGNSFGKSERMRARWTKGLQPKVKDARKEPVEYLWFVGDYASYHASLKDISLMTAEVFRAAELDFGLMYEGERNSGNDVRRVGEEGLFEMLVEKNQSALEISGHQAVVTTDPHTFNTLKNEYPPDGSRPVLHYTQLLDQLARDGRLQFTRKLGYRVTYHDPCYLGRYNDVYDEPRRVIEATGCDLVEMPRCRDRTFCCGAGGGRIWMPDPPEMESRPAEQRVIEAAALQGVSTLVVACPKDLVMFQDAVKTAGLEGQIVVRDLIELVAEALELTEGAGNLNGDEAGPEAP
jgi:Fe-S oxidoreductase